MKRILTICGLMVLGAAAFAQVSPQYSNFMYFRQAYNPGVAGSERYMDFTALYRGQWVGIEGAPGVAGLSIHAPVPRFNLGIGLLVVNEMTGAQRVTSAMINVAYGRNFRFGRLSGGVSIGAYQKALNGTELISPDGDYTGGGINHNDDYIPNTNVSGIAPELNGGVYFNNDKLFAGISVLNILQSKATLTAPGGDSEVHSARTYTLMGGYTFAVGKRFSLIPSVLLKSDIKTFQTDINLILQYKSNIYGGFSFRGSSSRTKDALVAMVGFRLLKNFNVGYSYDFSLSGLNNANSGSHEVYLNYRLMLKDRSKPGKIIYNPRFL